MSEGKVENTWEQHAEWWQKGFTNGADEEYSEQIIPLARELLSGYDKILDIGSGEGQISRTLCDSGADTAIGVDPTHNQIVEASRRGGAALYLRGQAEHLPFRSGSFDAAIACLVFEHIEEMDLAIKEVSRILRPKGKFVFFSQPPTRANTRKWMDR